MAIYNSVHLEGRLTFEPELRTTTSGVSVLSFLLVVNRPYQTDKETKADFIDCQAWRKTADFIAKNFRKGDSIVIEGSLQTSNFTDKDGNKRKSTTVVVSACGFCLGGKKINNTSAADGIATQPAPTYASADNSDFEEIVDDDDDLPF